MKTYMMVYVITKIRDSSFFQSEVKVGERGKLCRPHTKTLFEKPTKNKFEHQLA